MSEPSTTKPYVGLIPFHEEDAEFFFGREQEQEIITSNLMASRLTLLYGASGVGKSSVLHAGVAHNLRGLARRDIKRLGKPKFTVVIFSAWRDEPIASLLAHVKKAVLKTLAGQKVEPVSPNLSFVESLHEWSRRVQGQLLIILDQFEEYFLYHPNEDGDGTFAVEFPRAVNTSGLPVNFIVSYREDAHAKLDFFKGRIPNLYDNYLRIGHLGYRAARAAIVEPIARFNQLNNGSYSIQPELVAAVLSQVRAGEKYIGEVGKGVIDDQAQPDDKNWEVETPYLQLVMTQLWDTETASGSPVLQLETLNKLGSAKRIVQTHLDNAMGELSAKEQLMGANIFNYLVTPSGTKIAQTAHDLAYYAKLPGLKEKQLDLMMEKLTGGDRRILRSVPPPANQPNASRYEVFHDVLAQAILDWRRRFLARKERTQLLKLVGAMALVIVFMGGVSAFAWQQRSAAQTAEGKAKKSEAAAYEQRSLAEGNARLAEQNAKRAEVSAEAERQRALENRKLAASNKELADKFAAAYQSERVAKASAVKMQLVAEDNARTAESLRRQADNAAAEAIAQKTKADEAAKIAEELRVEARELAVRALAASQKAEAALATVEEIDRSNAYYKTVMRVRSNVANASFSADGRKALTVSGDDVVRVWDVNSPMRPHQPTHEWTIDDGTVESASFSPNSNFIVTVSNERKSLKGTANIWDVRSHEAVKVGSVSITTADGERELLFGAAFTTDGHSIIVNSVESVVRCECEPDSGLLIGSCAKIAPDPDPIKHVMVHSISPDGRFIVRVSPDVIYLWDTARGASVKLAQPNDGLSNIGILVAFSRDGKYVATTGPFSGAYVFETSGGSLISELKGKSVASIIALSSDGKLAATGSENGNARIWDIPTGRDLAMLGGHSAALTDLAFDRDGRYLVTASGDRTARVWDIETRTLFAELRGHISSVTSAAFSPSRDGNFVLTTGDKTARIWDVTRRSGNIITQGAGGINNDGTFDFDSAGIEPQPVLNPSDADLSWRFTVKGGVPGSSDLVTWALNPENKAQIAFFTDAKAQVAFFDDAQVASPRQRDFDDINVTELLGLNYSGTSITGGAVADRSGGEVIDSLPVNSIFAVRTSDGNYAKVQVLKRSTRLEIKWVTYKDPNPAPQQGPPRSELTPTQSPSPPSPYSTRTLQRQSGLENLLRRIKFSNHPVLKFSGAALNAIARAKGPIHGKSC